MVSSIPVTDIRARLLRELAGETGPVEPSDVEFSHWVDVATTDRVLPLLYSVAIVRPSTLSLACIDWANSVELDAMAAAVRIEHGLIEVAKLLRSEHIIFAVLKGGATAHLDYPEPSLRQFADIDILVDPKDFDRARMVLGRSGSWRSPYVLPRHHEHFVHAITLRNEARVEIDLHQRIAHRGLGQLIPTGELLDHRTEYAVAGHRLWALSRHDRLIHASVHAIGSRGPYRRLSSLADVLVLSRATPNDAEAVLARADTWSLRTLVGRSVKSAYSAAQLAMPDTWAKAVAQQPSRRNRLIERGYLKPDRRPVYEELAYLQLMDGWRDRYTYVRGYFTAGPEYARTSKRESLPAQTKYLLSRLRSK